MANSVSTDIPSTFSLSNHLLRSVLDAEEDTLGINIEETIPVLRGGYDSVSIF
jgi:hypothetical protein